MSPTVVVTSISGQQQSAVADAFHKQGWRVRGTSRKKSRHPYAEIFEVDNESGSGLTEAFRGADVIAVSVTQDQQRPGAMPAMANKIAQVAELAGVKRIIFNLAGRIFDNSENGPFPDMRQARHIIQNCAVPSTVLQPAVYMDNLLAPWTLRSLEYDGTLVYPVPAGAPVSWISHLTLGQFFVAAAENAHAAGQEYLIGGPEHLTAAELTHILGQRLHKELTFIRLAPDEMASVLNQMMGAPAGDRIACLYAELDNDPRAIAFDKQAAEGLRVVPESFSQFVERNEWKAPHR